MPSLQKHMWVFLVLGWQLSLAQPGKGLRVVVFLSPECPLCKNYTRTLNQLEQQYAGKVTIVGVVPGKTWKAADLTAFESKYHTTFPLQIDRDLRVAHSMHATTTPEAFLVTADNTVAYQGAIDNWYKSLGQASKIPTQNYLQDAIESVLHHQPVAIKKTSPIGCLINDF